MTCRELTEFLSDYLAGEIAAPVRDSFEHHLDQCPNCRVFLAQFRTTIVSARTCFDAPTPPIPEDLVQAVLAALKHAR